ncbi:hypothetical protein BK025_13880 [Sodalis sp. TME1]|nr:hypothetical protein BK025_13880 [Sodalis sp. TME1]
MVGANAVIIRALMLRWSALNFIDPIFVIVLAKNVNEKNNRMSQYQYHADCRHKHDTSEGKRSNATYLGAISEITFVDDVFKIETWQQKCIE